MIDAKKSLEHGASFPFECWDDDGNCTPTAATSWAHAAARGIFADLSDRKGIKSALNGIDCDVMSEIVNSATDIILESIQANGRKAGVMSILGDHAAGIRKAHKNARGKVREEIATGADEFDAAIADVSEYIAANDEYDAAREDVINALICPQENPEYIAAGARFQAATERRELAHARMKAGAPEVGNG